jgi:hypothetical protein
MNGLRPHLWLTLVGGGLIAAAEVVGGPSAAIGGLAALGAQTGAVALLRPAMAAPTNVFMARWLVGMALRAACVGALLVYAVTHRAQLEPLAASLGCLGVLLPLLFLETRFLR